MVLPHSPTLRLLRTTQLERDALAPWMRAGVNAVLLPAPWRSAGAGNVPHDADLAADGSEPAVDIVARQAEYVHAMGLACYVDVILDRVARDAVATTVHADWLAVDQDLPELDPRRPLDALSSQQVRGNGEDFLRAWSERLGKWLSAGIDGYYLQRPQGLSPDVWAALLGKLRHTHPEARYIAATQGMTTHDLQQHTHTGFDWTVNSLPWWDGRHDWFAQEDVRLRAVAPVLAPLDAQSDARQAWLAAFCGDGLLVDASNGATPTSEVLAALQWHASNGLSGPLTVVGGQAGRATLLLRKSQDDAMVGMAVTPHDESSSAIDLAPSAGVLPAGSLAEQDAPPALRARHGAVGASGCSLLLWQEPAEVQSDARAPADERQPQAPRLAIESVQPALEPDRLPIKCIAHEQLMVQATLIMDGHDQLAADLCWRACDERHWHRVPMQLLGNDRWEAAFAPQRIGAHEYRVQAWQDVWAGYCHEWHSKHAAGQSLHMPLREGAQWLTRTIAKAERDNVPAEVRTRLKRALKTLKQVFDGGVTLDRALQQLTDPLLAGAIRETAQRPHARASVVYPLWVDRNRARHAAWYELFPRSQAATGHGSFDDVIDRLPDIRAMGFDVLYLTPIHPIGERNRKGRNNSLTASPDDVGSPYAIGSAVGGHDAVAPELGTLEDFDRLVAATHAQGMEMALDFAIQCSPDHPWLKAHPNWFSWLADGSLRYAENPPKKYEDIVNVAFYESTPPWRRKPSLWRALRDIVLFWAQRGVRIFRVDNPHTKPLPFWQWLIAEVHAKYPDILFLSEAFTRPAMMYRLAKIGFTQSYTYFTWRNHRQELAEYFTELSGEPVASFFRPHFFVNTPDINPYYLQSHGRPGFLTRAALAATGSGLWGIYSGFELCESAALPGREEYLDSEKYELRPRDWHMTGNIRTEITQLNAIRRANPALQTHRGFQPLNTWPDTVMAYIKRASGGANVILVVINLDPQQSTTAEVRLPEPVAQAEDLLTGGHEAWHGGVAHIRLTPEAPYSIWRLPAEPCRSAT
ncbi:Alpha-1,4-glucan:maltose-1-phosphate maltosyltransferase [Bordetella tumbae]|uniref:alpha-1,4-glucan--maltose-1-phosphate maltosyltransferase n=1 Tax=Bordetella tumbae TaxID=1649139 RepID=UPI0039F0F254